MLTDHRVQYALDGWITFLSVIDDDDLQNMYVLEHTVRSDAPL